MKKYFLLVLLLASIKIDVSAQKIINLSDYGVTPNSYQNASENIARAIKDAADFDSCVIRFPEWQNRLMAKRGFQAHLLYF